MSFELKTMGRHSVLFVMAVDAEYGPHLKSRIKPLMTGVGPVEAAIVLSHALTKLQAENNLPDLIVSLGSAGSRSLEKKAVRRFSIIRPSCHCRCAFPALRKPHFPPAAISSPAPLMI
jgi:adenosylhomocysteine nucleosidase